MNSIEIPMWAFYTIVAVNIIALFLVSERVKLFFSAMLVRVTNYHGMVVAFNQLATKYIALQEEVEGYAREHDAEQTQVVAPTKMVAKPTAKPKPKRPSTRRKTTKTA